ncbi:Hsp20/alpha crystallin family protein [Desulfurivibrio alkaliphilus]|uniref:Heat shock protein Hsp20 n=1 Tax=Desulfurivibrio alkaliphilus (strain DSM 19089 / UNIQEM U267 / AHT2) TaxID=589865 RepID=D6YZY0_DESAT|nr:Hsp20/alpha crystallin family protein [Desulfurivibrio alkaliphilus]ADH85137.1 heat shock protein Hsp20 [Desulfurivibrio alkaliphilus AHT 2]
MAVMRFYDQPVFRNPWADFEKMRREFDTLFRNLGNEAARGGSTVFPALNISEDEHNLYVRAELPGVAAGDLEVAVEGDTLTIKGERRGLEAAEAEKVACHRREIESGRFSRALTLPTRVNPERVTAVGKNGILLITLPKAEEVKPRRIEIKTA